MNRALQALIKFGFLLLNWHALPGIAETRGDNFRIGLNGNACQFETIAAAVSAAQNGDVLFIEAGTYNERIGEIFGKGLTLQSAQPGSNCSLAEPFPGQRVVVDGTGVTGFVGLGGILDIRDSTTNIRQIDFTNGSTGHGGLVFVQPGSTLFASGSTFSNGIADADLTLTGGPAGTDDPGGGCIFANGATVILLVANFTNCRVIGPGGSSATGDGGAIHARNSSSVQVGFFSRFDANTARNGGAVFAENSSITIDSSLFDITSDDAAAVITFENNQAENGGAISAEGEATNVLLNQLVFTINSADSLGGAVRLRTGASAEIIDNSFTTNNAFSGGGVAIEANASANIQSSQQCRAFEFADPNRYCSQFVGNQAVFASALDFSFGNSSSIVNTGFFENSGISTIQAFDDVAGTGGGLSLGIINAWFAANQGDGLLLNQAAAADVLHATFDANTGVAIVANDDTDLRVFNSIMAVNQAGVVFNSTGLLDFFCNLDQSGIVGPDTNPQLIETVDGFSHLSATSPAIDACSQVINSSIVTDLDGFPRLIGTAFDMGAFEFGTVFLSGFE